MEAHHPSPERQPTAAHQQQLQPASAPEITPSNAPTLQSPSATDLPPASALELQPPHTPELQPSLEWQSSAVSSTYQRATADLESGLASVDAQPLSPPPSLRKRCLRGTSPHVESEGIRGASNPGSSSSEEPDDSNDEDWSTAESAEEDEEVTVDSGGDDSGEEDISINLIEVDVNLKVTDLIRADNCKRRCLEGKARELESLGCSISQMTKSQKMTSVYLMLGVLMQTDTVQRRGGKGEREKFNYYLPFVGAVCRPSFARCLDITPLTIQGFRVQGARARW
ncbi:hypothetical protein PF010_g1307 [Phytophthora fragariae]|uniref:Uncharacterized protein n=1 Tax=Phytophthora fragariae TaxID=53985 RepID=A0A6A3MCX2_9STRA|nr:hypothetical protein PF003_g15245 [Phytophthora fragariae]KAE9026043.1 hypothetical protein PF011_g2737 [Phytophthora fragariae]KAE9137472.1 hypothetical protein PF010_g1307 [Phytophthora fragariae]KAE9255915.1 hypothetical protein PF002_g2123 [Phytophthora fragariae]